MTNSTVEGVKYRVSQMEAKIRSASQEASHIQCVMEYRVAGRMFTPNVRLIVANLHTLNEAAMNTNRLHCFNMTRMSMAEGSRTEQAVFREVLSSFLGAFITYRATADSESGRMLLERWI